MDINTVTEKILKCSSYLFFAWGFICFVVGVTMLILHCFTNCYTSQFSSPFIAISTPFTISGISYLWGCYNYLCYRIMKICNVYIYRNEVLPPPEAQDPTNDV